MLNEIKNETREILFKHIEFYVSDITDYDEAFDILVDHYWTDDIFYIAREAIKEANQFSYPGIFTELEYEFSEKIKEQITKQAIDEIFEYLKEEVETVIIEVLEPKERVEELA